MSETLSKQQRIRRLAESSMMIALGVVLCEFAVFKLPFGGSVTIFGQVPLVILSYRYGLKWGFKAGLAFGVIQMLFGLQNFSYVTGVVAYFVLVLADYLVAFGVLGLGGMFRKAVKNQTVALALGAFVVSAMRFCCHFVSGATIWSSYAANAHMPILRYSLVYNGSYMLPEALITVAGVVLVSIFFDLSAPTLKPKIGKKHGDTGTDAEKADAEPAEKQS